MVVDNDGDTLVDEDDVEGSPPADGSREIWWSPDVGASGGMVKQVNVNTPWLGTETWELGPAAPPPPPVGGTIVPTDKLGLVMPWIMAAALIAIAGVSLALWNRKRGVDRASGR